MRKSAVLFAVAGLFALWSTRGLCQGAASAPAPEGYVNFSFDQADVRSFVKMVGELTQRRLVVDEDVAGKITVVSPKVPIKDVFPVFASILESVGCSIVEDPDHSYRVIKIAGKPAVSAPVVRSDEKTPEHGVITKVFRLKYVDAGTMRKALEPKVRSGKDGGVGVIEDSNFLLITDTAENIRRVEKIVEEVDSPGTSRITDIVGLKHAAAEDIAEQLTKAMGGGDAAQTIRTYPRRIPAAAPTDGKQDSPAIVASPHSNSLLMVGSNAQIIELKRIIGLMDVEMPPGMSRLRAIFLKYISAEDAAKSLNALLSKKAPGQDAKEPQTLSGPIAIEPHVANNALLVDAVPKDFEIVNALVQELDTMPEQVLVEVLIAEVSVSDGFNFGVDMLALAMPSGAGNTVVQGSMTTREDANSLMNAIQSGLFPEGLSVGLARGMSVNANGETVPGYPAMLNVEAIKKNGKFDILSNVPLLSQNNKEASVSIVNNIPILKSTITGTGTTRDVIQNIERIDVGIKLKLTPHINPGGEVMMTLNPSIEAMIDSGRTADSLAPTIARREVSATVTVPDGKTIVLSGLMRDDKSRTIRKVPILGSIPLIGWLFRREVAGAEKTNLLIFVTPHIIKDFGQASRLTESWKKRAALPLSEGSSPGGGESRSAESEQDSSK